MDKKRKALYWIGGLIAAFLITIISWMVLETGIEISSKADFCGTCHSMEPMVDHMKMYILISLVKQNLERTMCGLRCLLMR